MQIWTHPVNMHTREEIDNAVEDPYWQCIRRGMKGLPTEEKLDILNSYLFFAIHGGILPRACEVQVDNYINALLRGGQLVRDAEGNIVVQR